RIVVAVAENVAQRHGSCSTGHVDDLNGLRNESQLVHDLADRPAGEVPPAARRGRDEAFHLVRTEGAEAEPQCRQGNYARGFAHMQPGFRLDVVSPLPVSFDAAAFGRVRGFSGFSVRARTPAASTAMLRTEMSQSAAAAAPATMAPDPLSLSIS